MFCTNCGKKITQRASFCTDCGAPLVWPEEPEIAAVENENETRVLNEVPFTPAFAEETTVMPEMPEMPVMPEPPIMPEPPVMPGYVPASQKPTAMPEYASVEAPAAPKQKKKGKGALIALIVVAAVLALSLIAAAIYCVLLYRQCDSLAESVEVLQTNNEALSDEIGSLNAEYDGLYAEYNAIYEEYDFFHEHAVFCSEENNYYHTYDCAYWDRDGFWIYNSEYAIYKDYEPCPYCQ